MTIRVSFAELPSEDTITLTSMNFLQDRLSLGTIHCMGCGLHENSSASRFPLVECISLNHKMLFHYHWFLATSLVFLVTYTQTNPEIQLLLFPFYICIDLLRKQTNAAGI